ncbi:MAG: hypothetical protein JRH20_12200, partial [Deltaproteobacteria bacterium]|nr:hypothetical protein [Deltaproteobacteria bacterium]
CGNGAVETGETCDIGIKPPDKGSCPTACDDKEPCTADFLDDNKCLTECVYKPITTCGLEDGCCPKGCNANTDSDCDPVCGNGVVESGETCDTAIRLGATGSCPLSVKDCDDGDYCTADVFSGKACTSQCDNPVVTSCVSDRCCNPFCKVDPDCDLCATATCGNKDGCCPKGCLLREDRDCCELAACLSKLKDGCCPSKCSSFTDADCGIFFP